MYIVAVRLVVDPSDAEAFAERLKLHARNSLTQSGCKGFSVSRNREEPGAFNLWEVYDDADAFQEHVDADFMAEFREYSAPLVKERILAHGDQIA